MASNTVNAPVITFNILLGCMANHQCYNYHAVVTTSESESEIYLQYHYTTMIQYIDNIYLHVYALIIFTKYKFHNFLFSSECTSISSFYQRSLSSGIIKSLLSTNPIPATQSQHDSCQRETTHKYIY